MGQNHQTLDIIEITTNQHIREEVLPMTIISQSNPVKQVEGTVNQFCRMCRLGSRLKEANVKKINGHSCLSVFQFIFSLVFSGKNLWRYLERETVEFQKDTVYRFLNNPRYNWRNLLLKIAGCIIQFNLLPLTSSEREKVLVLDDSLYSRGRSKAVELLAKVFDHTTMRFAKGFRFLTLGWSDGNSFIPVNFALISSEDSKCRYNGINSTIDKRTVGFQRRQESIRKSTEVLLDLLKQTKTAGINAKYLLFDSWFSFPSTIRNIVAESIHVVCRVKELRSIRFIYQGCSLSLNELHRVAPKRRGRAHIFATVTVDIGAGGKLLPARIIFVGDREHPGQWIALLSTDMTLSGDEIIRIYGKRWDIEVFFKMIKSHLKLAKEFQGQSYDMMVAHTTIVCLRYIMLALESRQNRDSRTIGGLFYDCCDELADIKLKTALQLVLGLIHKALNETLGLAESKIEELYQFFFHSLPMPFQRLLLFSGCES